MKQDDHGSTDFRSLRHKRRRLDGDAIISHDQIGREVVLLAHELEALPWCPAEIKPAGPRRGVSAGILDRDFVFERKLKIRDSEEFSRCQLIAGAGYEAQFGT